ncbi:transporter substrate-binding domain-containing protein [Lichenibacterium minor]|jgi:octopine/nopaline transport system substrate-binding protein|uniref:Transporter substrate-binding domain-containing protein n=1 Tax=Lichenibacterium minor TaxID=2316528 RepID=A0A4Q2UDT2_9HYPH|nr:transporter substrate-binding domain-containing protein [Lichenibacterium minor]RYC32965.1 transporter substrate-binding domain-containing protein [Lichenibacterium minor]
MKRIAILAPAALAAALGAGPAAAKDWTKVTIATEGAYEPWNYVLPDGKLAGFEIDLAHDLCRVMKVECAIVQNDWDGMIPALNAGKFDAIMAGMSITAKRLQVIDFSRSYASGPSGFLVPKAGDLAKLPGTGEILAMGTDEAKAKPVIDGMRAMLKGKSIGVQVATIQAAFVHHHFDDVATVQEYKTADQNDLDLMAGRLDASFAEESVQLSTLAKPDAKDLAIVGAEFRGGPDLGDGTGVGLRKNEPELKAMFDRAIAAEIADGSLKKLQDKWFKLDMMPPG